MGQEKIKGRVPEKKELESLLPCFKMCLLAKTISLLTIYFDRTVFLFGINLEGSQQTTEEDRVCTVWRKVDVCVCVYVCMCSSKKESTVSSCSTGGRRVHCLGVKWLVGRKYHRHNQMAHQKTNIHKIQLSKTWANR